MCSPPAQYVYIIIPACVIHQAVCVCIMPSVRWPFNVSKPTCCCLVGPTAAAGAAGSAPTSAFAEDSCELHITPDIPSFDFTSLQVQQYQAILINTGWEVRPPQQQQQAALEPGVPSWSEAAAAALQSSVSSVSSRAEVVKRLAAIPLARLCPRGFIMIWVNKEHLQGAIRPRVSD